MGPKKQGCCAKINFIQMKLLYLVNWHSARASKSAKIVLSKSIFYVKNQLKKNFIQEYQFRRPFFVKNIFSRLDFWTTLLSKIRPKLFFGGISSKHFHFIFWQSSLSLDPKPISMLWRNLNIENMLNVWQSIFFAF